MTNDNKPREWMTYNPRDGTYDTLDGTRVAAELVDNAQSLADVLRIAQIRAMQRRDDLSISTSASTTNVAITASNIETAVAAMELAIAEANDKHPLAQYMVKHGVNHRTHYVFLNSDDAAGFDLPDFARASPNCPKGEVMFLLRDIVDSLKWPPQ